MAAHRVAAALALCATLLPSGDTRVGDRVQVPFFLGWKALGTLHLTSEDCVGDGCTLAIQPERRHRVFALGMDSPLPVTLIGYVNVTCDNGISFGEFLLSSGGTGIFQIVGNSCYDLSVKELRITVTSVNLHPDDQERGVFLTAYGSLS